MGKDTDALEAFLDKIPDSKLTGFPSKGNVYKDTDFRLDVQGMTSDKPSKYNLQVQVNNGTTISTLKKVAPKTVAGPVLATGDEDAATIRASFKAKMKI